MWRIRRLEAMVDKEWENGISLSRSLDVGEELDGLESPNKVGRHRYIRVETVMGIYLLEFQAE